MKDLATDMVADIIICFVCAVCMSFLLNLSFWKLGLFLFGAHFYLGVSLKLIATHLVAARKRMYKLQLPKV